MCSLTFRDIDAKLNKSLKKLFKEDKYLLEKDVNERSISHMLAFYLKNEFIDWDVDCEYNRIGAYAKKKIYELYEELERIESSNLVKDIYGKTVYPDIIVHRRGKKEENLLVIEIKKSNSRVNDNIDKRKLEKFCTQLDYSYGVFLKLKVCEDEIGLKEIKWICKDGKLHSERAYMPTYKEIMAEAQKISGRKIYHPCWIAEVKRYYGLTKGPAHNTGTGKGAPPCPQWAWDAIEQILKNHELI